VAKTVEFTTVLKDLHPKHFVLEAGLQRYRWGATHPVGKDY
jgi:hypothetical protein